jgi:hypothetical protein
MKFATIATMKLAGGVLVARVNDKREFSFVIEVPAATSSSLGDEEEPAIVAPISAEEALVLVQMKTR